MAYIRYKQVDEFLKQKSDGGDTGRASTWNKIGLFFGLVAAFGSCVVGAFQEVSVLSVHILGATMAFGGINVLIYHFHE